MKPKKPVTPKRMMFLSADSRARNTSGVLTTAMVQACGHFTIPMVVKHQVPTLTKIQQHGLSQCNVTDLDVVDSGSDSE